MIHLIDGCIMEIECFLKFKRHPELFGHLSIINFVFRHRWSCPAYPYICATIFLNSSCDFIMRFVSNEIHLKAIYQQEGMINNIH